VLPKHAKLPGLSSRQANPVAMCLGNTEPAPDPKSQHIFRLGGVTEGVAGHTLNGPSGFRDLLPSSRKVWAYLSPFCTVCHPLL